MTTYSVSIDEITVPDRLRKDLGNIPELAESIHRLGFLIHPIVIDRNKVLIAGERRLRACTSLGHDRIECRYFDELDELKHTAIEIEENIKSKKMTLDEECRSVARIHELGCANDPDWSQTKIAEHIGMSQQWVSERWFVHNAGKLDPGILKEKKIKSALRIARYNEDCAREAERQAFDRANGFTAEKPKDILNMDFCEWAKTYTGPRFNFIHCDFPYGIYNDQRQQGDAVAVYGGYDDSPDVNWTLLKALCENLDRICEPSAHLMLWFSMQHYAKTLEYLTKHTDFTIDEFPLVWMKSDGKGLLPRPDYGPRRTYETCLFGWRGKRRIIPGEAIANSYHWPTDSEPIHVHQKPESVLKHFFRMVINENSMVLDPTCGSGTALRAAKSLGAKQILGLEIDKRFADRAISALEWGRRPENDVPDGLLDDLLKP
jgi:ParB family chromosome partitioning protein